MGDTPAIPGSTYPSGAPTEPVFSEQDFKNFQACLDKGWVNTGDHYAGPPPLIENLAPSAWSPSFVKLFSSINPDECNLGSKEITDYQKLLAYYIQSILLPILCQYQNDPQEFQYALIVFNQIVEHLCKASRLEKSPHLTVSQNQPYGDLLNSYFSRATEDGDPFPVERMYVDRLRLPLVDPFNFQNPWIIDGAIEIWDGKSLAITDLESGKEDFQDQARVWSWYVYDKGIISPPRKPVFSDGALPLELEGELSHPFTTEDENALFQRVGGFGDKSANIPENAPQILRSFQLGLDQVVSQLQNLSLPPEAQLMGVEEIIPSQNNQDAFQASSRLTFLPSGERTSLWGLDGVKKWADDYNKQAGVILPAEITESELYTSLDGDFEKKWGQIQGKFRYYYQSSPAWKTVDDNFRANYGDAYDAEMVKESFNTNVESFLNNNKQNFYDPLAIVAKNGAFFISSPLVVFYNIQQGLVDLESGIIAPLDAENAKVYRFLIYQILQGITEVLEENQSSVLAQVQAYSQDPSTALLAEMIPFHYEATLSFFKMMRDAYKNYFETPGADSVTLQEPYRSPFVTNTVEEAKEVNAVLGKAADVLTKTGDLNLRQNFLVWPAYKKMKDDLRVVDVRNILNDPLFAFLEMNESASWFYAEIEKRAAAGNLGPIESVQEILLKNEEVLSREAIEHLPPDDALRFVNRLRYASYLFEYHIRLSKTQSERNEIDLAQLINSDLNIWLEKLPSGWPDDDGCSKNGDPKYYSPANICPDGGFKGDYTLNPNTNFYLTQEDFLGLFQLDSTVSAEEALTKLKYFFGDFDFGYYKYFSYGGYEINVNEEKLGYVREHVSLNQLLLVLQDIYLACEAKAKTGDESAKRVGLIAKGLALHIDELLHSPKVDDPFFALMNIDGEGRRYYTNILPATVVHAYDPNLEYGDEKTRLEAENLLWRAEHQADTLLDSSREGLKIARLAQPRAFSPEEVPPVELVLFEDRLAPIPALKPFETVDWYLRKGLSAENQYILGRLLEAAQGAHQGQNERFAQIRKELEATSMDVLRQIPDCLKNGKSKDKDFLFSKGFSNNTVNLLVSLTPSEMIWVRGYLISRITLADRYFKEDKTDLVYFEEMRQQELNDFLFSSKLTPEVAIVAIKHILAYCGIQNLDGLATSAPTEELSMEAMKGLDHYFGSQKVSGEREVADSLYVQTNEGYGENPLSRFENLYLLYLVSNGLYQNPLQADLDTLKTSLESYDPSFDAQKVQSFYAKIPDFEKPIIYRFLYKIAFKHYRDYMDSYFGDVARESSVILSPQGLNGTGNQFWGWMEEKINSEKTENADISFGKNEFNQAEVIRIYWAWRKAGIKPSLPNLKKLDSAALARTLNNVLEDADFYKDNQKQLEPLLTEDLRAQTQRTDLKPEEVVLLNLSLLSLVDPLVSTETRERKKLVAAVDEILAQDFGDTEKKGDIFLDVPTQLVLDEALNKLGIIFASSQGKTAFTTEMKDILMGPFDATDPVQKQLYSRYNPNRSSIDKGPPQQLKLVFSRDVFSAQTLIDDPFLLDEVQPVLTDMLQMTIGYIPEDQIQDVATTRWNNKQALEAIAATHYYKDLTIGYYENYNFPKVEEVKKRLDLIEQVLQERIRNL